MTASLPNGRTQPARLSMRSTAICALALWSAVGFAVAPHAEAVPAPEVEYTYNVLVRRHFSFPYNDAIGYGYRLCDNVARGLTYADVIAAVRSEVFPNDEQAANYVVSYAIGLLCPSHIPAIRRTASET